ncbi:glycosyltransferase family 90 protein [Zopfia rhizophila CBS 207.26]|uniref:Glycosyltransferase family 90 protein n=1 Tax=Zopfia rhizophila CBS 207.26 TaxID=1314779 RepID=A0A6A6EBZ4_9PEZI|nr:glycosyltransferase family 90 protein [Zopfia rhizophila CBS 207.26]
MCAHVVEHRAVLRVALKNEVNMDRKWLLLPCGLIAGTCYLSTTFNTSFAFDRPLHTIGIVLLLSGLAIIAHGTLTARNRRAYHKERYIAIPLSENGRLDSREPSPLGQRGLERSLFDAKSRAALVVALLFTICVRVAIYQRVMKDVECAGPTALAFLPFILAVFHAARNLKLPLATNLETSLPPKAFPEHVVQFLFRGTTRYILPSFLLSLSEFLAALRATSLRSTYICPTANGTAWLIPKLQFLGFLIDCTAVLVLYSLIEDRAERFGIDDAISELKDTARNNVLVGLTFIVSAVMLAMTGIIAYTAFPEHRQWILAAPAEYITSLISLSFTIPCTILCFLFTVRLYGVMSTVLIVGFSIAYTELLRALRTGVSYTFPPKPTTELTIYLILLTIALILYLVAEMSSVDRSRPKMSVRFGRYQTMLLLFIIFSLSLGGFSYRSGWRQQPVLDHPISTLIKVATEDHDRWAAQAYQSKSLADAVKHYQERYFRDPPPGFDKWYEFATIRSSIIIDDYDNIEEDLAPFSSLSAAKLRQRTAEILAHEDVGLGGISIRNGKAEVFANVPGTHRWMVDGAITMIQKFAEFLPDMDLAMNLNDECRVAIPFARLQQAREQQTLYPDHTAAEGTVDFSPDRASTWPNIAEIPKPKTSRFMRTGFNPTFQSHGSVNCPPESRARLERHWNTRSLCTSCAAPHSMGAFVANWSSSTDPCHQPDLANLHGLHLSPSALIGTHDLVPIFSQSKAPGYADIRYPSPWNYMDKAVYAFNDQFPDPPFKNKEDTLFWRGATSEGVSAGGGAWKGMLRQRLVHLLNNETERQIILLPTKKGKLKYVLEETETLKHMLPTKLDVRFVNKIVRCGGQDCGDQESEFGFGKSVDFQQHWRYRYLFDADGAGFSGRFLPFLQSNSVVFKTALFREWYEGRLKAWKHFVPVDLRLHDLWSSIAYFGGYGVREGERVMEAREKEAERIARDSKVWAEKVLRKEDMEIYYFRLLLEWGRLTDDKREEVRFRMPGAGERVKEGKADGGG